MVMKTIRLTEEAARGLYEGYLRKGLAIEVCDINNKTYEECHDAAFKLWCRDNEIEIIEEEN